MTKTPGKLGTAKTAERIGISVHRLAMLRIKGEGPVYYKIGRKILYGIVDIDAWLEQRRRTKSDPSPSNGMHVARLAREQAEAGKAAA